MPTSSLVHSRETQAINFKTAKDRVSLLGCTNAAGICKLPLTFIHRSARPCRFKHMDMSFLYWSQSKAWMDTKHVFMTLLKFVPHVKKFCEQNGIEFEILLLLDNTPAHPSTTSLLSRGGEVTTMYLPPNTMSILQSMDQGNFSIIFIIFSRLVWYIVVAGTELK